MNNLKKVRKIAVTGIFSLLAMIFAAIILVQCGGNKPPQLGKSSIKKVIAAMTLEEKAYFVTGARRSGGFGAPPAAAAARGAGARGAGAPGGIPGAGAPGAEAGARGAGAPGAEAGARGAGMRGEGAATPGAGAMAAAAGANAADTATRPESVVAEAADRVPGAAGTTYAIPRLGIPSIVVADGPAGLRISPTRENDDNTYYCTAFPVATLLASTWDTSLVRQVGQAMGNEVHEYGVDIILGPALNIHRNPLAGRNFEYFSEDPLIAGEMAAAMVKGIQSDDVGTSIKHFVANNAETNRNTLNTFISQRALREIYLDAFKIPVETAQPWTVMSSYNLLNDVYTSESEGLITEVLRNDWGFQGFVMTDWGGGTDPIAQMKAGNDLLMPGNESQAQAIIAAVRDGSLDESILDRNVEKILNIILKSPTFKGYQYSNKPDLEAHAQITRQAATDGMVLLSNVNSTLPFAGTIKNIAAFGNTSYNIITGGTGSGDVNEAYNVSLVEGLENSGYTVNQDLINRYDSYIDQQRANQPAQQGGGMMRGAPPIPEMAVTVSLANSMAASNDVALITIGRNSGEGSDRSSGEGDFQLSKEEVSIIRNVTNAFHAVGKKAVVILNVGGVIETASWKNIPDAILLAWQGGQETGNSIADILSGKVNPSGRLATTFPVNYSDNPSSATFPGKVLESETSSTETQGGGFGFGRRQPAEVVYNDGIYVGYRYYETFGVLPSYEFGYGLSYTTFSVDNLQLSSTTFDNNLTVTVDVTNTGNVAGQEVVQLYLSAPDIMLEKPERELKGFVKTQMLQPGETQTVSLPLTAQSLASFDTSVSSWIAEPGTYDVKVGVSSMNISQEATFELPDEIVVKKVSDVLAPDRAINEISAQQ